jgi:hypothetical protein
LSSYYNNYGNLIPSPETDYSKITAKEIMDKIHEFHKRTEKEEDLEHIFLGFLADYPISMTAQHMTDTLKLMVALLYLDTYEEKNERTKETETKHTFSYEQLSIIFCRSKSTISTSVDEKSPQAEEIHKAYQTTKRTALS